MQLECKYLYWVVFSWFQNYGVRVQTHLLWLVKSTQHNFILNIYKESFTRWWQWFSIHCTFWKLHILVFCPLFGICLCLLHGCSAPPDVRDDSSWCGHGSRTRNRGVEPGHTTPGLHAVCNTHNNTRKFTLTDNQFNVFAIKIHTVGCQFLLHLFTF